MKDAPASVRTFAVLGSEFHLPSVKIPRKKHATAISEHRAMAVADALGPTKRERIKAEAQERAAAIMAEHERKKGRG